MEQQHTLVIPHLPGPVIYSKVQRFSRQSSSRPTEPRPPPHAPDRSSYPWDESEKSAYLPGLRASPLFQHQEHCVHPGLSGQSRCLRKRSNASPSSTRLRGGIPHALAGGGNRAQHRVKLCFSLDKKCLIWYPIYISLTDMPSIAARRCVRLPLGRG